MLTFRLVTLRWIDPALAWVAVPMAASIAATTNTCLKICPHRIALPRSFLAPARSLAPYGPVCTIVEALIVPNCATVPAFIVPSCDIRLVADWPV
ncbi:hypothetical protein BwSH20_23680 [Bradyrhizobium ottawaense]|nr:hypothetical protein BwSF21_39560 [Bradyrhizobium ottawaense]GMO41991.1 hypothetical protein BwSH14_54180 [Bradyrhizobium ottawaense]GMO69381.1 hypothetical protein BwSG20_32630 [Bradyrhizobium ottawaense]GMO83052.1 hypothetical protein BwSG10_58730 [Bradyrhizobium ottawaense]GMO88902.1 hypothetical protein BwSF19_54730 [Bradyrhizobium ottawaense]